MRRVGVACAVSAALAVASATPVAAQSPLPGGVPPPPGMTMPAYAAHRFPQPVRVGALTGEVVQRPVESHQRLGTFRAVVRTPDGTLDGVIDYGGWFGFGGHAIAVPLDALALLGPVVEIVGFTPRQLDRFPPYSPDGATVLPNDATVKIGLAKPSH